MRRGRTDRVPGLYLAGSVGQTAESDGKNQSRVSLRASHSVFFTPPTDIFPGREVPRRREIDHPLVYCDEIPEREFSLEAGEDWFLNTHVKETLPAAWIDCLFQLAGLQACPDVLSRRVGTPDAKECVG